MRFFRRRAKVPQRVCEQAVTLAIAQTLRDAVSCFAAAVADAAPDRHDAIAERLDWHLSQHAARMKADGPISTREIEA